MEDDDDEDYSNIRLRAALPMGRFPPENKSKSFQEKLVVQEALESLKLGGFEIIKGDDPPDVCVKLNGQKIGVEVVEFVDQEALYAKIKKEEGRALNDKENLDILRGENLGKIDFLKLLNEHICAKDVLVLGFSEYWLVVHTVEPNFFKSNVGQWLLNAKFGAKHIDRIILKLDYSPGTNSNPGKHPVFELKIEKTIS